MHLAEKDDTLLVDVIDRLVNMLMRDEGNEKGEGDKGNEKGNDSDDNVEISSSNSSDANHHNSNNQGQQ